MIVQYWFLCMDYDTINSSEVFSFISQVRMGKKGKCLIKKNVFYIILIDTDGRCFSQTKV